MNIEQQFNRIAEEYDGNRRKFIPCFDAFYKDTTALIAANIVEPKRIVDLGAGTGLLTSFWYRFFPDSQYVLVDIAEDMLQVARKRFADMENVSYRNENYIRTLPQCDFDAVISALSVHHLEDREKHRLFSAISERLPRGGIFVNYDQFCASCPQTDRWYTAYWENHLENSGLTERDITLWKERRKLDRECSVRRQTDMLRECGFQTVECVFSHQKFSVIVAITK